MRPGLFGAKEQIIGGQSQDLQFGASYNAAFFSNVDSASRAEAISRYINIMGAGMGLSGFLALLAICIAGLWIWGDQQQQKRERREREKWERGKEDQSKRDQKWLEELKRKLERLN